eukprot:COSAG03_NODE_25534_length_265_cov_0.596386_1_plen_41_part_10
MDAARVSAQEETTRFAVEKEAEAARTVADELAVAKAKAEVE